jgi:hypothetical protein
MHRMTKNLLKRVVEYITNDPHGDELYNILTALRGPDDANYDLKECTTAVLRNAVGLLGSVSTGGGYDSNEDSPKLMRRRKEFEAHRHDDQGNAKFNDRHFLAHIKQAFEAVGLDYLPADRARRKRAAAYAAKKRARS